MDKKKTKNWLTAIFFIALTAITLYTVFKDQNFEQLGRTISDFPFYMLIAIIALSFLYVTFDGIMISSMMKERNHRVSLTRCVGYAFVCFFYSGITPSASGGQPIQLLYMKRDGLSFSRSCAMLTAIEAVKKTILAFSGLCIIFFLPQIFVNEFVDTAGWYYLGCFILIVWSVVLWVLMFAPSALNRLVLNILHFLTRCRIFKFLSNKDEHVNAFFDGYRDIDKLLTENKKKFFSLFLYGILQRISITLVTSLIFIGFGYSIKIFFYSFVLQLAISVAVDMLPLPGGQGIFEVLFQSVFSFIATAEMLTPIMLISRFTQFYLLLIFSAIVSLIIHVKHSKKEHHMDQC